MGRGLAYRDEDFGGKPIFVFRALKRQRLEREVVGELETWALFPVSSLVQLPAYYGCQSLQYTNRNDSVPVLIFPGEIGKFKFYIDHSSQVCIQVFWGLKLTEFGGHLF